MDRTSRIRQVHSPLPEYCSVTHDKESIKLKAALERMELYVAAHPRSPSAIVRPQLLICGSVWVALLGSSITDGIVGFGSSVEAALRAFDAQYLFTLHLGSTSL